jgi:hypothetical protein
MQIGELVIGSAYMVPGCQNVFTLTSRFMANKRCFTRQDGERHFGREFIEYKDGKAYVDLRPAHKHPAPALAKGKE